MQTFPGYSAGERGATGKRYVKMTGMTCQWLDRLLADDIILLDGGTGSELQRRGVPMNSAAWSGAAAYTHREILRDIHVDYIRAGAEIITTNTFGTSRFVLDAAGLGAEFSAINALTVDAAIEARDTAARDDIAIAGSISCLPPHLDVAAYPEQSSERDGYRELAEFLAERGVDLLALEMMEDTHHAAMAMEAALEVRLPIWLGVSCRFAADGKALVGFDFPETPISEPLSALLPMGPSVVNVMHTDPKAVATAIREIRSRWNGPLGVYPELGNFSAPNWNFSNLLSADELVACASEWVTAGARLLGGCCGTTPEHIRGLSEARAVLLAAR